MKSAVYESINMDSTLLFWNCSSAIGQATIDFEPRTTTVGVALCGHLVVEIHERVATEATPTVVIYRAQ